MIDSHSKYLDTLTSKPFNAQGINTTTIAQFPLRISLLIKYSHICELIIINKQIGIIHFSNNFFIYIPLFDTII